MTDKEKQLGAWLSPIADELNITETMLNRAISSYEAPPVVFIHSRWQFRFLRHRPCASSMFRGWFW